MEDRKLEPYERQFLALLARGIERYLAEMEESSKREKEETKEMPA